MYWYESLEGYDHASPFIKTSRSEQFPNALSDLHAMLNDEATRKALRGMQAGAAETGTVEPMQRYLEQLGASDYRYVMREVQVGGTPMLLYVETACFDGRWFLMPAYYYSSYIANSELPLLIS